MTAQHCCQNSDKKVDIGEIREGDYIFKYYLTYCKNCGNLVQSRTYIDDGCKIDATYN